MSVKSVLVAVFLGVGLSTLSGCAAGNDGKLSGQTGQDAGNAGLEKGRGYFMRECGRCHRVFQPAERSVEAWPKILASKKNKVSLTAVQFQYVVDYVMQESARAQAKP